MWHDMRATVAKNHDQCIPQELSVFVGSASVPKMPSTAYAYKVYDLFRFVIVLAQFGRL